MQAWCFTDAMNNMDDGALPWVNALGNAIAPGMTDDDGDDDVACAEEASITVRCNAFLTCVSL